MLQSLRLQRVGYNSATELNGIIIYIIYNNNGHTKERV